MKTNLPRPAPVIVGLVVLLASQAPSHAGQNPQENAFEMYTEEFSMHRAELESHRQEPPAQRILPDSDILRQAGRTRSLVRVVYGYYPYWVSDLESIRFDAITHLAWFAVELDSRGKTVSAHGWPDTTTVEACHEAGVKFHLAFTLFDGDAIKDLVTNNAKSAIDNMIDLMESGDADGISVDFEGLKSGTRDYFTTFICELRKDLDDRGHPDAQISIAGPAVDWNSQFDLDALLDCADWFFIMGYGYFWSGSSVAGPIGMLKISSFWRQFQSRSMLRSLADYSRLLSAPKRRKLIHGVPYYGREWTTVSGDSGSQTTDHVGAVTYSASMQDLADGRQRQYDTGVENPWYSFSKSGSWHQVWYDDAESLAAKYSLALDENLGGIGIWALNYDAPHAELWDLLEEKFSSEPEIPEGHRLKPIPIDHFPFNDSRDTSDGPGCYFNFYSCDPDLPEYGREWAYEMDLCQTGSITAKVPEYQDRDPDLALLDAPTQDSCLARAHTDLEAHVSAGRYLLIVDTFVDSGVELPGPYELTVDFTPDPGAKPCSEYLVCKDGVCQCDNPSLTDCGTCTDMNTDPENCGECNTVCEPMQTCEQGICKGSVDEPDGGTVSDAGDLEDEDQNKSTSSGCQCGSHQQGRNTAILFLALLGLMRKKTGWI